uniref:Hemagglutinin/protease n=1 Tax=uncultured bacterium FLS12 TaxID=651659 RepID=C5HLC1_9BACT|nr:hemagglutinin/protease [uncultured bacterium FLS12]
MRTPHLTQKIPRAAAVVVLVVASSAAMAQRTVTPNYENRWHLGASAAAPTATAVFNGHVGTAPDAPNVPHGAGYAILHSRFGLPAYIGAVPAAPGADTDGDLLPDAWEETHNLDPQSDAGDDGTEGDPDNDLWTNIEELYGNSDPRNPNSAPTPVVTLLDVPTELALVVGGSPIAVEGVFLTTDSTVTLGGALCADVAVDRAHGIVTLTATAPPGTQGPADVVVVNPGKSSTDTWADAVAYTADPFASNLDTTPGAVRTWNAGSAATLHVYLPASGVTAITTPQGTELTLPAALRTGYQAGFIVVREAPLLAGLPLDRPPLTPDGFVAVTPAFDIGGLVWNGAAALEIDEPFAQSVTVTFPVTVGTPDDTMQLGYIETHLDADLSPFVAVAPEEDAALTAGPTPTAFDPGLNTVTFELNDFTAYAGLAPGANHPADVNQDSRVNAVDVQLVVNSALSLPVPYDCDINADTNVNAVDVQLVVNAALGLW